ncbi:MAG: hypothetical protein ACJLTB_18900 [Algoriphagus aquaeductus]|uniref:hypothetical protein n=1 Tax=Algoriphagus aquaeductus TaxID=475299 RepID=UPI003879069C
MKNLSPIILLMILALVNISCKEDEQPNFAVVDMVAFITVLDQQGNNLLNPSREGSFKAKDIKIFYERNGKMEEFFEANLDMPRNFRIDPPEFGSDYLMALVLDAEKTVIQWNKTEADTLKAEIYDDGRSILVRKVFFQGELKHDVNKALTRREFTIVK